MKLKRVFPILAATLAGALGIYFLQQTQAAPGQFAITPSSTSVVNGNNITVTLRIDPSSPASALDVNVSYDHTKLQYVSTNPAGSAFGSELGAPTGGGGTVHIVRGITPGNAAVSGDALIAQVTFKALAGSGSTGLTLSGEVAPFGEGGAIPTAPGSGTVSLTAPVVPVPAPPSPSPSPGPSPSPSPGPSPSPSPTTPSPLPSTPSPSPSSPSPAPTPTPTPPGQPQADANTQTTIELASVRRKSASFKITSAKPVKAYLKYGLGNELNLSTTPTALGREHELGLSKELLVPGTTYSYVIVTEDEQGKVTESQVYTLKTKGYSVRITVRGRGNKVLAKKMVTLRSDPLQGETDAQGIVAFADVAPGQHTLEYADGGQKYSQTLQIEDNVNMAANGEETAATQNFSIVFQAAKPKGLAVAPIIAVMVLVVAAVAFFLWRRSRGLMPMAGGLGGPTQGSMPTDTLPPVDSSADALLRRVPGAKPSDPGTVIVPGDKDKKV